MKITEEPQTITFSSFTDREIFTQKKLNTDEQFFINVADNNGKLKFQGVYTINSLLCNLSKDWFID